MIVGILNPATARWYNTWRPDISSFICRSRIRQAALSVFWESRNARPEA
jgi:hypothetical protein